jgi:hypothetical protein
VRSNIDDVTMDVVAVDPMRREYPTISADKIAARLLWRRSSATQTTPRERHRRQECMARWAAVAIAAPISGKGQTEMKGEPPTKSGVPAASEVCAARIYAAATALVSPRSTISFTLIGCQRPPRGVRTPLSLSALAIDP